MTIVSKRKSFYQWYLEKVIEYGHVGGGTGWMVYWIFGLFAVVVFDVAVLRVNISILSAGYVILTILYLIWTYFNRMYSQYWEDTTVE